MKNITVSVEDEVYFSARRKAAEQHTSISQIVAEFLRSLSREDELREERRQRLQEVFQALDRRGQTHEVGRLDRAAIYDPDLC